VRLSDKPVTIIPKNTYTQTAYARAFGLDPKTVYNMIKDKRLKVIEVNGTRLILTEAK
jgi:hypothetical protein